MIWALLIGLIIGIERELKGKYAGIKTSMFITLSAYLFVYVGLSLGEAGRILAAVISGVGFIGGGAIIFAHDKVQGLTSAAIIWLLAGLGAMVGVGHTVEAITTAVLIAGVDLGVDKVKGKFLNGKKT